MKVVFPLGSAFLWGTPDRSLLVFVAVQRVYVKGKAYHTMKILELPIQKANPGQDLENREGEEEFCNVWSVHVTAVSKTVTCAVKTA